MPFEHIAEIILAIEAELCGKGRYARVISRVYQILCLMYFIHIHIIDEGFAEIALKHTAKMLGAVLTVLRGISG